MNKTPFTDYLRKTTPNQQNGLAKEAIAWLKQQISTLWLKVGVRKSTELEDRIFDVGGLYYFHYDPKTKDILPYYDTFPLVIPLIRQSDRFIGLNLHYLPPVLRATFMDKLYDFALTNEKNEIRRLQVTYEILNATSRYREFRPCIKTYIFVPHIRSRISPVKPSDWQKTIFLPTEQFQKQSKNYVWQESIQKIKTS